MPTGLGGFDAQGVWQFGELDTEVLMSDMWNKGMRSVSDQLVFDRARLDDLEDDTGWVNAQLMPDLEGSVRYRVIGQTAEIRYDITGTLTSNMQLTQPLPANLMPTGDPTTLALPSYVNSPSNGAIAFLANDSNTLRFVGLGSRVRGGGPWFVG